MCVSYLEYYNTLWILLTINCHSNNWWRCKLFCYLNNWFQNVRHLAKDEWETSDSIRLYHQLLKSTVAICQQMFKNLVHQSLSFFLRLWKNLEPLQYILCPSIWQGQIKNQLLGLWGQLKCTVVTSCPYDLWELLRFLSPFCAWITV